MVKLLFITIISSGDPDRFERIADVLGKQAAKTAAAYDALVRRAQQKFEE